MFSVVVVYNDEEVFKNVLLKSLKKQSVKYELISINNTEGKFFSATEALNYGGKQATGKYIMFVHQDVELDTSTWLEDVEYILNAIPDIGIAGAVGMSENGKNNRERGRGFIDNSGEIWLWSNQVKKPEKVQTIDECLLIVPKFVFDMYLKFDEKTFDGWHCYGADYCLSVKKFGLNSYVIPAFIYHRSKLTNRKDLIKYQSALYMKHKKQFKNIYTTCGEISLKRIALLRPLMIIKPMYKILFKNFKDYLIKELKNCESVLDLGCGYNSPIQYCKIPFSVGVELHEQYLKTSISKKIHSKYIKADIRKVNFDESSFDAVVAIEVIEHFSKKDGLILIEKMKKWSRKRIIITTPNGFIFQEGYHNNPLQKHKSGWSVKELRELGFIVYGINGWKRLRGHRGEIKYYPKLFWTIISDITQKFTYYFPELSFQLIAIKEKNQ